MKPFTVILLVALSCGFTQSYTVYGNKRFNRMPVVEPVYTQSQPHYLQPQYLPAPYRVDDYNYNARNAYPSQNQNYVYYPRQDYQQPLYGVPTYRGEYQPKPYSFAQPSYRLDEQQIETTNPLDYLHEEILQENERERSLNNAAFMQNLALYNKQDSLQGRQQQIQQMQELYNLRGENDPEDYDIEQPSDWYDRTAILVDPSEFDAYKSEYPQPQPDYDDEMVKELRDLTKHSRKNSNAPRGYDMEWQRDMPQEDWRADNKEIPEEYEDENDDWINWGGQKRSIQPKKVVTTTTVKPTESSKIIAKLQKNGQKEVVLPRPATPVRKPFTEPVMKMMKANEKNDANTNKVEKTLPIYKTIKEIIDMEQNLSHLSNNEIPTSKIRKRFVTNEEALAQQLNGLKRTSK